jgi:hypothetical protein
VARRRRRDDSEDVVGGLIFGGLILVGSLAYGHMLPPRITAVGHELLVDLSPALAQRVESAFPAGHADFGDLVPYIGLLFLLAAVLFVLVKPYRASGRAWRHTLGELLTLTPAQFEHAVAGLLRSQGYRQVRVVGGPGDLQADIVARDAQGRRVVAQCKQYAPANRIGSPMIQTFIGMVHVHHKAQIGIFVTTSSYTDAALDLARQHGLIVYDGSDLSRMMAPNPRRRRFRARVA